MGNVCSRVQSVYRASCIGYITGHLPVSTAHYHFERVCCLSWHLRVSTPAQVHHGNIGCALLRRHAASIPFPSVVPFGAYYAWLKFPHSCVGDKVLYTHLMMRNRIPIYQFLSVHTYVHVVYDTVRVYMCDLKMCWCVSESCSSIRIHSVFPTPSH